jgi:hypothetical protein
MAFYFNSDKAVIAEAFAMSHMRLLSGKTGAALQSLAL